MHSIVIGIQPYFYIGWLREFVYAVRQLFLQLHFFIFWSREFVADYLLLVHLLSFLHILQFLLKILKFSAMSLKEEVCTELYDE